MALLYSCCETYLDGHWARARLGDARIIAVAASGRNESQLRQGMAALNVPHDHRSARLSARRRFADLVRFTPRASSVSGAFGAAPDSHRRLSGGVRGASLTVGPARETAAPLAGSGRHR